MRFLSSSGISAMVLPNSDRKKIGVIAESVIAAHFAGYRTFAGPFRHIFVSVRKHNRDCADKACGPLPILHIAHFSEHKHVSLIIVGAIPG
jgi:hypothetical protein